MKISKEVRFLLVVAAVIAALLLWRFFSPFSVPHIVEQIGDDVAELWSRPYFNIGNLAITPALLVKVFVFLALLSLGTTLIRKILRSRILNYTALDEGRKFAIERVAGYAIFTIGLLVGLQSTGVDFSTLAVIGGAVGIGIGLGLQNIAKNFAAGLILLIERPIKVGDRVEVGELVGTVVKIGARGTWVRTNDNVVIILPNGEFVDNRVTNWTANDRLVRINVALGVSYGSRPEQVRQVLLQVAKENSDVMESPAPDVIFRGFGDSSLDFELRVWTTKQVQTPKIIASDIYFAVFRAFQEHNIEIPFPQRDLHLKSVSLPIPIAADSRPEDGGGVH